MARRNRTNRNPQRRKSVVSAKVDRVIAQLVAEAWDALTYMGQGSQGR